MEKAISEVIIDKKSIAKAAKEHNIESTAFHNAFTKVSLDTWKKKRSWYKLKSWKVEKWLFFLDKERFDENEELKQQYSKHKRYSTIYWEKVSVSI